MAETVEIEIKADTADAVAGLKKVEAELKDVGEATEKSGEGWGNLSQKVTAGAVALQGAIATVQAMIGAVQEMAADFERTAGILNRFNGDIGNATERINGLISNLDLMSAQSKIAAAGIELTAEQFGDLTVAASETAARLGTDAQGALDQFVQSLVTGGGPAADLFKEKMDAVSGIAEKQAVLIGELTDQFGDMESSADTLGGEIGTVSIRLENFQTELIDSITNSGELEAELSRLRTTLGILGEAFTIGGNDLISYSDMVTAVLVNVTRKINGLAEAVNQLASNDLAGAAAVLAQGFGGDLSEDIARVAGQRAFREQQARVAAKEAADARALAGGGGGRGRGAGGGGGAAAAAVDEGLTVTKEAIAALNQEWLDSEQTRLEATKDAATERAQKEIDAIEAVTDALEAAKNERGRVSAALHRKEIDRIDAEMASAKESEALTNEVVGTGIAAGDMLVEAFAQNQGQKEIWQSVSDFAMAITSFAQEKYAQGALFLLSGALHAKNAAEMGVGGGAGAPAGAGGASSPTGGAGGSGGQQVINNVNINSPVSERDMGRMQRRVEQERARRFDSRV